MSFFQDVACGSCEILLSYLFLLLLDYDDDMVVDGGIYRSSESKRESYFSLPVWWNAKEENFLIFSRFLSYAHHLFGQWNQRWNKD